MPARLALEKQMSSRGAGAYRMNGGSQLTVSSPGNGAQLGRQRKKRGVGCGRNASLTLPWQLSSSSEAALSRSSRLVMLTQSCASRRGRCPAATKAGGGGMRPHIKAEVLFKKEEVGDKSAVTLELVTLWSQRQCLVAFSPDWKRIGWRVKPLCFSRLVSTNRRP